MAQCWIIYHQKVPLYDKQTRNYKFSLEDTDKIQKWMKQSLRVNLIKVENSEIDNIEDSLIKKYTPLVNISKNPKASEELKKSTTTLCRLCKKFVTTINQQNQ